MISLNCHSCPHFDSDTMDCCLDCEDVLECMRVGNPYVDKGNAPMAAKKIVWSARIMHDAITGRASTGGDRVTNGEKKAILLEYRAIERRINRLIDEKAAWNAKATATTSSFSDMPRSGGGSDKIQTTVEKIIEIEEKLDHEIDALVDLRNRIEAAVEKLEDGKLRVFMEYKYIGGMTNEEAAMEMNYSSRQGDRFHAKALALIDLS